MKALINGQPNKELTMAKHVTIDTEECIGCQNCVEICPEVFGFDDDAEKAFVLNPDGGEVDCAEEATASCPAECIDLS